MLLNKL